MFSNTDDPDDIDSIPDNDNPGKTGIAHHRDDYDSDGYHKNKKCSNKGDRRSRRRLY